MTKFISIRIHDANHKTVADNNRFFVETESRAPLVFEELTKRGWEIVSVAPFYNPNILEDGCFAFFIGGFKALLKKEADEDFSEDLSFIKEIAEIDC